MFPCMRAPSRHGRAAGSACRRCWRGCGWRTARWTCTARRGGWGWRWRASPRASRTWRRPCAGRPPRPAPSRPCAHVNDQPWGHAHPLSPGQRLGRECGHMLGVDCQGAALTCGYTEPYPIGRRRSARTARRARRCWASAPRWAPTRPWRSAGRTPRASSTSGPPGASPAVPRMRRDPKPLHPDCP